MVGVEAPLNLIIRPTTIASATTEGITIATIPPADKDLFEFFLNLKLFGWASSSFGKIDFVLLLSVTIFSPGINSLALYKFDALKE